MQNLSHDEADVNFKRKAFILSILGVPPPMSSLVACTDWFKIETRFLEKGHAEGRITVEDVECKRHGVR